MWVFPGRHSREKTPTAHQLVRLRWNPQHSMVLLVREAAGVVFPGRHSRKGPRRRIELILIVIPPADDGAVSPQSAGMGATG